MIESHSGSGTVTAATCSESSSPPYIVDDEGYVPPPTDPNRADYYSTESDDQRKFQAWADRLDLTLPDLAVFCKHGFRYEAIPSENTASRRALLTHLKRVQTIPSKWVLISGLYPEMEYSEAERRKRLRALYKALVLLIKRALLREAADPLKEERSIYWDPIAEVCRHLEIAPSKLSSLMREFSGHSLSQLVDCVRVERIQKVMRIQIRSFVKDWKTHRATLAVEKQGEVTPLIVWKALKASRQWPEFCQNSWAIEFGFANYRRMYRACLAVWKQTPHQMEMALITECLKTEGDSSEPLDFSVFEPTLAEIEEEVNAIQHYFNES